MKTDVVIIGAGLFGCVTAAFLRKKGFEVIIVDNQEPMSASKCALGVWKEGWVSPKIKDKVETGLPVLNKLYGVEDVQFFDTLKNEPVDFKYIDPEKILDEEILVCNVRTIDKNKVKVNDDKGNLHSIKAKRAIIVCAGVWTTELLVKSGFAKTAPTLDSYWGAQLEVAMAIDMSRIQQWAPYKQSVLFKRGKKKFVFSDGATVKNPVPSDKRIETVSPRIQQHANEVAGATIPNDKITKVNEGLRPYIKGDGDFVQQHSDMVFSATGGAKSSLILSGYVAKTLYKLIKDR